MKVGIQMFSDNWIWAHNHVKASDSPGFQSQGSLNASILQEI